MLWISTVGVIQGKIVDWLWDSILNLLLAATKGHDVK